MAVWIRSVSTYAYGALPGLMSYVVPRPATYANGSVIVAFVQCQSAAIFAPTGWTQQASSTASGFIYVFTKIASSSEPATYTFDNEGIESSAYFVLLTLGGVASSSQIGGAACDAVTETGNPLPITAPSFTSSITGSALWLMMHYNDFGSATFTAPSGYVAGPSDLDLAGTYAITYATAIKDGVTSGSVAAADGTINVNATSVPFWTAQIGIASGSVDPRLPVFDSAIFDPVVFDTTLPAQVYSLSFTDNISTVDQSDSFVLRIRIAGDDLTVADEKIVTVSGGGAINVATLTDVLTILDAFLSSEISGITASESITVADAFLRSEISGITASESITVADEAARQIFLVRTVEDALSIFDDLVSTVSGGGTINVVDLSDLLVISDGSLTYVLSARLAADALLTADQFLLSEIANVHVQDGISLADALLAYALRSKIEADSLILSDAIDRRTSLARALLDDLALSDTLDVVYIPGAGFVYDVKIRVGAVQDELIVGHSSDLRVSWDSSLALSHDTIMMLADESLLEVGGY